LWKALDNGLLIWERGMRDLQNTSHSFVADLYKFDRSARLICTAWVQLKKLFLNKTPVICFGSFSAENAAKDVWRKGDYWANDYFQPKWGDILPAKNVWICIL